ncbi:MAG: tRNA 2-thiocytidine biosynthesis TtcA family protein [Lachnospirales bacterium]
MSITVKDIERSLIKTYRKPIWKPFIDAINEFELIKENDKIAICISGGKDSMLLAKLMQEIQRHGKIKFHMEFLAMDPGYNKKNKDEIFINAEKMGIPIKMFNSDIFEVSEKLNKEHPCYLCARMRRGFLYNKAQKMGCNKIALGHHMDDVIETTLLNICYAGSYKTMLPKLKSANFEGMELIRPMFYIKEHDILNFVRFSQCEFMQCGCKIAEKKDGSKRSEMKELIKYMKILNNDIDKSIMRSAFNVNLDGVLGFKSKGEKHSYLDFYDDEIYN